MNTVASTPDVNRASSRPSRTTSRSGGANSTRRCGNRSGSPRRSSRRSTRVPRALAPTHCASDGSQAAHRCGRVLGLVLRMPPAAVPIARAGAGRPQLARHRRRARLQRLAHRRRCADRASPHERARRAHRRRCRARGSRGRVRSPGTQVPDIERNSATLEDLEPDERRRAFLRYWTCKEAMSKATGDGLIAPVPAYRGGSARPCAARRRPSAVPPARMDPCYCAGSGGVFRDGRVVGRA